VSPFAIEQKAKHDMEKKVMKEQKKKEEAERKTKYIEDLKARHCKYTDIAHEYFQNDDFDKLLKSSVVNNPRALKKVMKSIEKRLIGHFELMVNAFGLKLVEEQKEKPILNGHINGVNHVNGTKGKRGRKKKSADQVPEADYQLLSQRIKVLSQKELIHIFVQRLGFDQKTSAIDFSKLTRDQIDIIEECLSRFEREKMEREMNGIPEEDHNESINNNIVVENYPLGNILDSDLSDSLDESSDSDSESIYVINFQVYLSLLGIIKFRHPLPHQNSRIIILLM
jgi:hypothetical protein